MPLSPAGIWGGQSCGGGQGEWGTARTPPAGRAGRPDFCVPWLGWQITFIIPEGSPGPLLRALPAGAGVGSALQEPALPLRCPVPWGARSQHTATNLHTPRWSLSLPKEGAGRVESSTSPTPTFPLCAHPGKCHISLCPRLLEVLGCAPEWRMWPQVWPQWPPALWGQLSQGHRPKTRNQGPSVVRVSDP